jgi:hypothetical protein
MLRHQQGFLDQFDLLHHPGLHRPRLHTPTAVRTTLQPIFLHTVHLLRRKGPTLVFDMPRLTPDLAAASPAALTRWTPIFRRLDSLTNKLLHDAYFRKTDSGLGFMEGLKYLVEKRWLAATVGVVNCHEITKSGRRREV